MQADQVNQASILVELMQIGIAAPDVPSAVTPILERLVEDTTAVGATFFQERDDMYVARATSGQLPDGPVMDQILTHGLPAETPLMIALKDSPQPFFFTDTERERTTVGFPELGVTSLAAAPVREADGTFVGAFLLHTFERHSWLPDEANLFAAVAGAIGNLTARLVAEEKTIEVRESALRALGLSLEFRGGESDGHTDRVAALALALGDQLDLDANRLAALRWGAFLHDIGKNTIPEAILLKPDSLTEDEWKTMRGHVEAGYEFASRLGFLPDDSLDVVRYHHERWDGTGYPARLAGKKIPKLARIFAVCDVYDALVSDRPFRHAWTHDEALTEIRAQSGEQFDPVVVDAFVALSENS